MFCQFEIHMEIYMVFYIYKCSYIFSRARAWTLCITLVKSRTCKTESKKKSFCAADLPEGGRCPSRKGAGWEEEEWAAARSSAGSLGAQNLLEVGIDLLPVEAEWITSDPFHLNKTAASLSGPLILQQKNQVREYRAELSIFSNFVSSILASFRNFHVWVIYSFPENFLKKLSLAFAVLQDLHCDFFVEWRNIGRGLMSEP